MMSSPARHIVGGAATDLISREVLDLDHLSRQAMHDADLEREVVGMFFEQSMTVLRQIRDAAEPRQRSEAAHRLKGSARAVGAWRVAAASDELESLPAEASQDQLLHLIAGLHASVAEARSAIAVLLNDGSAGGL